MLKLPKLRCRINHNLVGFKNKRLKCHGKQAKKEVNKRQTDVVYVHCWILLLLFLSSSLNEANTANLWSAFILPASLSAPPRLFLTEFTSQRLNREKKKHRDIKHLKPKTLNSLRIRPQNNNNITLVCRFEHFNCTLEHLWRLLSISRTRKKQHICTVKGIVQSLSIYHHAYEHWSSCVFI